MFTVPQQPPAMQPSWSTAAIAVTVLLVAKSSGMAVPASGRGKIVSKLDGKFTSTTSFAGQMMLRCDLGSNVSAAVVDSIREDFGTPTPRARTFPWGRMSGERWIICLCQSTSLHGAYLRSQNPLSWREV